MAEFKLKCPKNYPLTCNLLDSEKSSLERTEKFKAFLIYQFDKQDTYLVETIKSYFHTPTYYVFDAREEVGLGIKTCKICRLALASDFGIAVLTPFNYNVFLEIGLLMGLGKNSVYIVSNTLLKTENKTLKDIPFDLSDQLVIEHSSREELLEKLKKEIPLFIEKIQISTAYEKTFREYMENKIRKLDKEEKELLKLFTLEQREQGIEIDVLEEYSSLKLGQGLGQIISKLWKMGFIKRTFKSAPANHSPDDKRPLYLLEESYRPFLQEYFWK